MKSAIAFHILLGTRAQLIKMAPILLEMERRSLPVNLVLTGQHQVTMQELLADFGVRTPPRRLYTGREVGGIVHMGLWFAACLWKLLWRSREWFPGDRGVVVVHGDTVSTLLGALAGRCLRLPVAHVESGLRSFNRWHPFPEELTRLAVFRLATVGYCPGAWACGNLRGYPIEAVDTGQNTLLDAVRQAVRASAAGAPGAPGAPYFVASIHRFENLRSRRRWAEILRILERLSARARCLFVLHPVTEAKLRKTGDWARLEAQAAFQLIPRMAYTRFVALLARASFVVTDGGSNQEELSYLGVPAVLMRDATERQEGLGGNALLSHYNAELIDRFLDAVPIAPAAAGLLSDYPSCRIVDDLVWRFGA